MEQKLSTPPNRGLFLIVLIVLLLLAGGVWTANTITKFSSTKLEPGEPTDNSAINPAAGSDNLVTADDPSYGSPRARIRMVEFSDFQCPYCKNSYPIVKQLLKDYGDQIYFVYRDFPLATHAQAQQAAEAAECAHEQNMFWPMHDIIFENQQALETADLKKYARQIGLDAARFDLCLDQGKYALEVKQDYLDGKKAGVRGTPTFFINQQMVFGSLSLSEMKQIIDQQLTQP